MSNALKREEYANFLKTEEWLDFRKRVSQVFHNECWFCKTKNAILQVHHTRYVKRNRDLELLKKALSAKSVRWVLLVCRECHQKIHEIQWERGITVYGATKIYKRRYHGIRPYMSKKVFRKYLLTISV